jgi:hypothetical protein
MWAVLDHLGGHVIDGAAESGTFLLTQQDLSRPPEVTDLDIAILIE